MQILLLVISNFSKSSKFENKLHFQHWLCEDCEEAFGCLFLFVLIRKTSRRSRPEVFCKKGVLRNFTKFTGKHLCQSLSLRPATLWKRRLWHRCFPAKFCEISKNTFFYRTLLVAASELQRLFLFPWLCLQALTLE